MTDNLKQRQCPILNEVEMHVEAIQRLVKAHGLQNNIQELEGQVCDDIVKCENSDSLLTISHHIEIIHQVIHEKKTNFQSSSSSLDQKNMANPAEKVSVVESGSTEKALKNSVVLRTIMNYFDAGDLLRCRLVNKIWKEEATIQLLSSTRTNLVKFIFDEEKFEFKNTAGTLNEFTDRFYGDPLRKFPCSRFVFGKVIDVIVNEAPRDLSNFFSIHGHHVKSLTLDSSRNSASIANIFRKIIFGWTPNLKSLILYGDFDVDDKKDEQLEYEIEDISKSLSENCRNLSKLSLEQLEFYYSYAVGENSVAAKHWSLLVRDILSSSPHLKVIFDENLMFIEEITSTRKTGAIRHLKWRAFFQNIMPRYVQLLQSQPQLTFLQLDLGCFNNDTWTDQRDPPRNFLPSLQLILQSNRETLKTLEVWGRLDLLTGISQLKIPVMENLQKFCLRNWTSTEWGEGRLLPEGFSLKQSFPRLKTLKLGNVGNTFMYGGEDHQFGHDCNSSTAVQELIIQSALESECFFPASWLCKARNLYPNVRVLHLDFFRMDDMPEICCTIWKSWNKSLLEELSILNLQINSDCEVMDQALTGFDQETCTMLQRQHNFGHCQGGFKRGPSILDMKKLKLFQLTGGSSGVPPFSRVSVIHAFEPMRRNQNLKVKIDGIELKELIQHVSVDFSVCPEKMDESGDSDDSDD